MTQDKSKWSGEELFYFYSNLGGDYSQTLFTARMTIGDELLLLLEKCEREGKIIDLIDDGSNSDDSEMKIVLISKPQ